MPNNIAVSITADVADLQVKRAILSSELKAAQKDLNDFAKTARTSGSTDELRKQMLASADAVARLRNQVGSADRELKSLGVGAAGARELASGAGEAEKAMGGLHVGTAGVTRELIVLAREAGRGNFSRMAGSATILAQRLGIMTPQVLAAGAAIGALLFPIAVVGAAFAHASADAAKFENSVRSTGNFAGITASEFEDMATRVAKASDVGIGTARGALLALIASGRFTSQEIEQLGRDAGKMSELTGTAAKDVLADFVKMADGPARYAEEFNRTHHAFTTAQLEEIKTLEDHGHQSEATAALVRDMTGWLDRQKPSVDGLSEAFRRLGESMAGTWSEFEKAIGARPRGLDEQIKQIDDRIASLRANRGATGSMTGLGPGAPAGAGVSAEISVLERLRGVLQAKADAEHKAAQATADSTRVQAEGQEAYEKSHQTFLSLHKSADQAREAVKALNDEMATRLKANPNDAEAKDYFANKSTYDSALTKRFDRPGPKGPGQVQEWQAQFRTQQLDRNDLNGDETQKELDFWKSKVGATTKGSKEWIEVQGKVYELSRQLARQDYEDHVAALNDRIEADKDSWVKEQADWNEKLAYIKSKHGEESKEYAAAHKELEAAERAHQQRMLQIEREAAQAGITELKSTLETNQEIRQRNAATAEGSIRGRAKSSANPLAEINAERQVAAISRQLDQQKIADLDATYAKEDTLRRKEISDAEAAAGKESEAYKRALQQREQADQQYYNQRRNLENQAANQSIQSQQKIAAAWHQRLDPLANSLSTQIKGLVNGTESWGQALKNIGEDIESELISAIVKMAENWIIAQVVGQSSQTAVAETGILAYAAMAGAAGTASFAGAPYPIDLGAPGFGAAMYAAAAGYALGGFDKGLDVVPQDMVAQIHAGERIVPKADNAAMISAMKGGGGGGGDTHNTFNLTHSSTVHGGGSQDVLKALAAQPKAFAGLIKGLVRAGHLKTA